MTRSSLKNIEAQKATLVAATLALTAILTGCGGMSNTAASGPQLIQGAALHGAAYGGRQPIAGATLYLYAASTTSSYTSPVANTNLLPTNTTTNPDGTFNITSQYTCTAGQMMYMVALGGNTGAGTNPQAGLMAALGDCTTLHATPYINLNEITTLGSVFALAPFMQGYATIGAPASNAPGLVRAFNNANKLMNVATGLAGGPALAPGATVPATEIYTLANVLASCVNTTGGYKGDSGTTCGNLFGYATPAGGTAPTNTVDLAMLIAQNPALNTANEYIYSAPTSPYGPVLSQAPNDWTMSINYTTAFSTPKSTTIDASGNVWVANSATNKVVVLNQSGAATQVLANNGLNAPAAIAIDASGNAFVANAGPAANGTTVSGFTSAGGVYTGSPFTVGTQPQALAFDAGGNLFVANTASNSITELNPASNTTVQTLTAGITAPTAVAIDPK